MDDLQTLRTALLTGDAELLHTIFKRARQSREVFLALNRGAKPTE
jgi:hypothetical protein